MDSVEKQVENMRKEIGELLEKSEICKTVEEKNKKMRTRVINLESDVIDMMKNGCEPLNGSKVCNNTKQRKYNVASSLEQKVEELKDSTSHFLDEVNTNMHKFRDYLVQMNDLIDEKMRYFFQ